VNTPSDNTKLANSVWAPQANAWLRLWFRAPKRYASPADNSLMTYRHMDILRRSHILKRRPRLFGRVRLAA